MSGFPETPSDKSVAYVTIPQSSPGHRPLTRQIIAGGNWMTATGGHLGVTSLDYLYCARDLRGERGVNDDERLARQGAVRQAVAAPVRSNSPPQFRQAADRLDRLVRANLHMTKSASTALTTS